MATVADDDVFDRQLLRRRRDRAAAGLADHDFLLCEVADRLADRLFDIARDFPLALDLGCHTGQLGRNPAVRQKVGTVVAADLSAAMLRRGGGLRVAADEEFLPFAAGAFDLVLSCLSLHWVNDLPGALLQARHALKPDGVLLAAMLGGDTLWELRAALLAAESELSGGASPRVAPMADLRDAGGLLQRAGFALPVVDSDRITLTYATPFDLFAELRRLGETSVLRQRHRVPPGRRLFVRAAQLYHQRFAGADGRIPATFDILYLTGWAPHASQQQPLAPGSARHRLADSLGTVETPAGDKARPR